ncbi:pyrrolidone-carboxylate peptidase, partial [Mycobacterium tuberculosis]
TGVGPDGGTPGKPAQLTAEELEGRTSAGATGSARSGPNTGGEASAAAQQASAESEPAGGSRRGEDPGRSRSTGERRAQNGNDGGRDGLADGAG